MRLCYSVVILVAMTIISGCASSSDDVRAAYVSPLQYQHLSCQQVSAEADRVSRRAAELSGVQDSKRTSDVVATTAAVILFWPAAFLVKGDGQTAAELARLKGEFDALERISIEKRWISFRPQTAAAPPESAHDPTPGKRPDRRRPPVVE